jgi:hypothetical protein
MKTPTAWWTDAATILGDGMPEDFFPLLGVVRFERPGDGLLIRRRPREPDRTCALLVDARGVPLGDAWNAAKA